MVAMIYGIMEVTRSCVRKLVLDLLSVSAMLAEYERTFSSAKVMISSHRNNLSTRW